MTKSSGSDAKNTLYCSFCCKSQYEVKKLIAGPTVFICDECVELCSTIVRVERELQRSHDTTAEQEQARKPSSRCSFCDLTPREAGVPVLSVGDLLICAACAETCVDVFRKLDKGNTTAAGELAQRLGPHKNRVGAHRPFVQQPPHQAAEPEIMEAEPEEIEPAETIEVEEPCFALTGRGAEAVARILKGDDTDDEADDETEIGFGELRTEDQSTEATHPPRLDEPHR